MSAVRILWGVGTSRTLRAHWMLHELGLAYERKPITSRSGETHTPEYIALNPSRKIPTLVDGDFILAESAAIVNYLATAYGAAKGLQPPTDVKMRARYDQWCFFTMMELDANTLYVIRKHEDLHAIYGEAPAALDAARKGFAFQAEAAEKGLAGLTGAAAYYNAAVMASILQWGGTAAQATAYLARPGVTYVPGATGLKQIGVQKWIALFTQGTEAWSEWRRTGNPASIKMGPSAYSDVLQVPRRLPYASNEQSVNAVRLAAAIARQGADNYATRMWWDK